MEMREAVIALLREKKKNSCKTADLKDLLQLQTTAEFAQLSTLLEEMEDNYEIVSQTDGTWALGEQVGIATGILRVNKKGLGFVDRETGDSVRFDTKDQLDALDGDTVIYQCQPWQSYGQVLKVVTHAHTRVIGTYVGSHRLKLVLDNEKLQNKILKVLVDPDFTPVEGLKVQCEVLDFGKNVLKVKVDRVIGHKDDPGVDISSVLLDHDIEAAFPEEVMQEVDAIGGRVKEEEMQNRVDLRTEITVTIDGDDSKDFDDAVSVRRTEDGWVLKVSIADVSHYVTEGSALDREALKRGCSTYVIDRVVPMLPHQLSNGICSLNPHVIRLTNTCEMVIRKDGSIAEYKVYPSVICSTERMTYRNVNRILDGDEQLQDEYAHLGTLFTDLADCADAIRRNRYRKGAIDFDGEEAYIKVDENGNPTSITLRERGHAECMIEDCMIAANVCVANQMKWAQLPSIYRIHEEPSAKRIKNFVNVSYTLGHKFKPTQSNIHPKEIQSYLNSVRDTDEFPVLSMMMLRCMQKARYDANCVGHFGLAEEEYLHFTSPIRRYPDLIVHRMLRKYVFEGCTDAQVLSEDEAKMQEYAEQSSIRERISQDAEYECEDMKKAQYMEKFIGKRFEGIISGVTSFGFFVELPNTVEGLVRIQSLDDDYYTYDESRMELFGSRKKKTYRLGQKVKVICASASRQTGQIDFTIANTKQPFQKFIKEPRSNSKKNSRGPHKHRNRKEIRHGRKK